MSSLPEPFASLLERGRFREALTQAGAACESAPAGLARAGALEALGVARRALGHYSKAEAPLLQALSLRAAELGKEHPDYAQTMIELGRLYEEQAQFASAERLFRGALAITRAAHGEEHPQTARQLHDLAGLCDQLGRLAEADDLYRRAADLRRRLLPADHPEQAPGLLTAAWAAWRKGQLDMAERLARQAEELLRAARGEDHPEWAVSSLLLARLLLQRAQLDEAERLARRARDRYEQTFGPRHQRHAGATEALALIRAARGEEDAEGLARQALEVTLDALGPAHPFTADARITLATVQQARGERAEAERGLEEALATLRAALGEGHPHQAGVLRDLAELALADNRAAEAEERLHTAIALLAPHAGLLPAEAIETSQALARALAAQGRLEDAGAAARQAVERARSLGNDSPLVLANAQDGLARVYQAQGRLAEAEPLWREVLAFRGRALGLHHPLCAEAGRSLAGVLAARGELAEALRLEEQALRGTREALGEHHAEYAAGLSSLAQLCALMGHPDRAEALCTEAVERQRERVGEEHLDHIRALLQLARFYLSVHNAPAAEVRLRQVLGLLERIDGEELPEHADALHDLGELCHQVGDLASAERLLEQASEQRRERLGEDHADTAQTGLALASVLQAAGRLDDAEPLFRQAVATLTDSLGENHQAALRARHLQAQFFLARGDWRRGERQLLDVADRLAASAGELAPARVPVLMDLARASAGRGDALAAEPLWQQITRINSAAFPDEPMVHAQDRIGQALTLRALGELEQAEGLIRESLDFVRHARGADHPDLAAGLGVLAGTVQMQGRLDEAETIFRQAADLARKAFGQGHPIVLNLQAELASLEASRGRADEAEALLRQTAELLRRSQGEDSIDYTNLQRHLAALAQARGRHDEAEALLRQRLGILRRMFGASSPVVAPALQLLAEACRQQGRLDEAESLCRQAVQLAGRATEASPDGEGPAEPGLGVALAENNLAAIYLTQNKLDEAAPLLRRSLEGTLASVGEDHPASAGAMNNLAALHALAGRNEEALALYDRLARREDRLLPQALALSPDQARAAACQGAQEQYEGYLALALRHFGPGGAHTGPVVDRLFEQVLRRKRFGMEALAASPWPLWAERYPEHAVRLRRLWLLDRQVATKRMAGPGAGGLQENNTLLAGWLRERDAIEEELVTVIPELARRRRLLAVDAAAVACALPPGWALIEVVMVKEMTRGGGFGVGEAPPSRRCVAFLLRAGDSAATLIDLGDADQMEQAALAWRATVEVGEVGETATALRTAFWQPLAPHLEQARGLVLALDGELLHAPLAALPLAAAGPCLHERYALCQVIAGRDLVRGPVVPGGNESLVLSTQSSPRGAGPAPAGGRGWLARLRSIFQPPRPRPPTSDSAAEVAAALHAPCWRGPEANRERALTARWPRVLYLDVGAFFLPDPTDRTGSWETPLVRSGLVFAGDQRLSSLEITRLDLTRTELVVLTGTSRRADELPPWGRLSALAHAFLHAGAGGVLLSLWPGSNEAALLTRVAEGLRQGAPVAEAMAAARGQSPGAPREWARWVYFGGAGE